METRPYKQICRFDNDFPAGKDIWDLIEIRSSGGLSLLMLLLLLVNITQDTILLTDRNKRVHIISLTKRLSENRTKFLKMLSKDMQALMLIQLLSTPPISVRKRGKSDLKNDQFRFEIMTRGEGATLNGDKIYMCPRVIGKIKKILPWF